MTWVRWAGVALVFWASVAQALSPQFEAVAPDQIPRDVVGALAQDRQGFLWVATGDGLTRFDGTRLQPRELTEGASATERKLGWVRALLASRNALPKDFARRDMWKWIGAGSLAVALELNDPLASLDTGKLERKLVDFEETLDEQANTSIGEFTPEEIFHLVTFNRHLAQLE